MSKSRECLDTNIIVYAFTHDDRATMAREMLRRRCLISVQALNEFVNVARRKLAMTWPEIHASLAAIREVASDVLPIDLKLHESGVAIAERHKLRIFDGLIIATALAAGCDILWSEDMQHGMLVEDRLRILNPFVDT